MNAASVACGSAVRGPAVQAVSQRATPGVPAPRAPALRPHLSLSKDARAQVRVASQAQAAVSNFFESKEDIKAALLDSLFGTDRGLNAKSEVRAEISELISQLEGKNPTPSPTEELTKLDGTWRLAYTTSPQLLALLALGQLPGVEIGDVTQKIDSSAGRVQNKVDISAPFSRTALSTSAAFEIRSPKRLNVKFDKGTIQTPELLANIEIPASLDILGNRVDLSQFSSVTQPVEGLLRNALSTANGLVRNLPGQTDIPIDSARATTWLVTTYLDDDTRVSRGDGGAVFILTKEEEYEEFTPEVAGFSDTDEPTPSPEVAANPATATAPTGTTVVAEVDVDSDEEPEAK
ncbi:unnamed protein product [Pedinophyceae sp. YPF-701]|nr:unnamed protein product [Pedinophyceae sp. YPF-701]